jgi:hypothetical protein
MARLYAPESLSQSMWRPQMRTVNRQEGLSLIEVTIILLVLMLLASVLAPSIYDFV